MVDEDSNSPGEDSNSPSEKDSSEHDDAEPSLHLLFEKAATDNTSLTTPWFLVLNDSEEEAYQATLTARQIPGTIFVGSAFLAYAARRLVLLSAGRSSEIGWTGFVANMIYFCTTGAIGVCVALVIRWRCQPIKQASCDCAPQ